MENSSKQNRIKALGLALVVIGVPVGMYLNYLTGVTYWSNIIMLLMIILLFYKERFTLKIGTGFRLLFFYQLYMTAYCIMSSDFQAIYLFYHLYILVLIVALSIQKDKQFVFDSLRWIFYLSIPLTLLGLFLTLNGLVVGDLAWQLRHENEDYALDPFNVGIAALNSFFAGLCLTNKRRKEKVIFIIMTVLNIYLIYLCGKRTPMVILIIGLLYYTYLNFKLKKGEVIVFAIIAVITAFTLSAFVDFIEIGTYFENIVNGVKNIMGDTSVSDRTGSAIIRYQTRLQAYEYIEKNFYLHNYLFGAGYMTLGRQFDNPVLQAFLDMGIIGVLGYVYLVIVFPVVTMLKKRNNIAVFFILVSLYNVFSCFSSGYPYFWSKYTPICLLIFSLSITLNHGQKRNLNHLCSPRI
ncbi:hypothetical protein [Bacteroides gallinaceum]|uniref:hypothetical protein n=1 Tax=Bacteroides gallinaceum TaxID=1462571 RepID=UPI00195BDB0D|nr:hypothetical protein [Bacteroides gallinaceum]MBM6657752.1 hypothetical protein [Bacteroides gallinaceum]